MSYNLKIFGVYPSNTKVEKIEDRVLDFAIFLFQVLLGVGAKVAMVSMKQKITRKYLIASVVIACFVGYLTDSLCTTLGYERYRGVAVSVMALVSETTVKYILNNGPRILSVLIQTKAGLPPDLVDKEDKSKEVVEETDTTTKPL